MAMIISTLQMKKLRPKELNTCSVQANGQVESRDSNSAESVPLFTMLQLPPFSSMAHDNVLMYIYWEDSYSRGEKRRGWPARGNWSTRVLTGGGTLTYFSMFPDHHPKI